MMRREMLARRQDPHTSHEAAAKVDTFKAGHEAKIYEAICNAGGGGSTYREVAEVTGLEPVSVARRLSSMERRKLICRIYDGPKLLQRLGMAVWYRA